MPLAGGAESSGDSANRSCADRSPHERSDMRDRDRSASLLLPDVALLIRATVGDKANAPPARLRLVASKRAGCASFFVPLAKGGQSAGRRSVRKVAAPWRALTARRHRVWRLAPHGRGARARRRSTAAFSRVRVARKPQVAVLSRICAELLAVRALAAGRIVRRVRSPKPPRERRVQNRGPQGPPPPAPPPFAPVAPFR